MKGYRTIIANVIALLASIALMFGLEVTPEQQAELGTGLATLITVVNMILRSITTTPIGKADNQLKEPTQ